MCIYVTRHREGLGADVLEDLEKENGDYPLQYTIFYT